MRRVVSELVRSARRHPAQALLITFGCLVLLGLGWSVNDRLASYPLEDEDIYFILQDGKSVVLEHENVYSRIHGSDMRENDKYTTYFPAFYYFAGSSWYLFTQADEAWFKLWRQVNFVFYIAIAALIFYFLFVQFGALGAFLGATFFMFNRWTLTVLEIAHIEPIPILFLLASLLGWRTRPIASGLMLGVSLAVKQIAIFLIPLYLIWAWHRGKKGQYRFVGQVAGAIAIVPIVVSLPFLVSDPVGLVKSVFFSATRDFATHITAYSLDVHLRWTGLLGKLPMLTIMGLLFGLAYRYPRLRMTIAFWVMVTFVSFNSVLFVQYFMWPIALLPFMLIETVQDQRQAQGLPASETVPLERPAA